MKEKLLAVLAAQRALRVAADDLATSWSENPDLRNRPARQALTCNLMASLPKPAVVGEAVYKIADECGVEI